MVAAFRQYFLARGGEPSLKVDMVREVGAQFGQHRLFGNVIVDAHI
jgi:hypothetical protein